LFSLGVLTLEFVAIVGSVYFFALRRRHLSWGDLGLRAASRRWLAAAILLGIICIPLTSIISLAIMHALGLPLTNPQAEALAPEGFSWAGAIGTTVLGGFVVPFAEELFFRGVLYSALRNRLGIWLAALVSAFVFGLAHMDISVGGAAFVLGIVLALVYEYSTSLWACFTIHAINNAAKIIVLYALLASGVKLTGT
jgi:membrane protease YdiL (CAAX protease family)